ncbi:MAG TPA: DUF937 domain-containing protein, partial [Polyangiaceae bacterium]
MNTNIVEMVTSSLSPEQIERGASTINVPSARLRTVMPGAIAAVLAGLMHRASTPGGKAGLTDAFAAYASPAADRASMLDRVLGRDKVGPLTDVVAGHAGLPRAAGGPLLGLAVTAVMGFFGKLVASHQLGANGIGDYLMSQHAAIAAAAPAGLATALGLRSLDQLKHAPPTVTVVASPQPVLHRKRSLGTLIAALAALAVLALGVFVATRHVRAPELPTITGANIPEPKLEAPKLPSIHAPAMPAIPRAAIPPAPAIAEPAVRNPLDTAMMGTSSLPAKLPLGTIEFPFASATPTAESMAAIDALATSLKAHDGARVRL